MLNRVGTTTFVLSLLIFQPEGATGRLLGSTTKRFDDVFCPAYHTTAFDASNIEFELVIDVEPLTPGFGVFEGPVWTGKELLFSNIGLSLDGNTSPSDLMTFGPNGLELNCEGFDSNGLTLNIRRKIFAARQITGAVEALLSGRAVASTFDGVRFNSPNDLVFSGRGNLYFTDPTFQAGDNPPQAEERAYFVDTNKRVTAFATDVIDRPNGVYLTKDEDEVLVGGANGLYIWQLDEGGKPTDDFARVREDIIEGGVDGMSRDCAGNLYVTTNGQLVVLSPGSFDLLGSFEVPGITNVAFGGADGRTLYATALGARPALWKARVDIPGLPF